MLPVDVASYALIFRNCLAIKMGRPTGLEPATPRFTILCSNQLSYDRRKNWKGECRWQLLGVSRQGNQETGVSRRVTGE